MADEVVSLDDNGRSLFSHYKVIGHRIEITPMRVGGFRVECRCDWYNDVDDLEVARGLAKHHIKTARINAKAAATAAKKARDNETRAARRAAAQNQGEPA